MGKKKEKEYEFGDRGKVMLAMMEQYGVSKQDLIQITGNSEHTVTAWMRPCDNNAYREPPKATIALLRYAVRDMHLL